MLLGPAGRPLPVLLLLGALATGCATTKTVTPEGSFVTGGSGKYGEQSPGQPAKSENVGLLGLFSDAKKPLTVTPKTQLAYAQYEELRGNQFAAQKNFEEQRASHMAARKSYEAVLAKDDKAVDAVIGLARLDEVAGRVEDAEKGFLRAVRLDNASPRSLDAIGQFYVNQKRFSEAVPTFEKAVADAPHEQSIRFHYGVALARAGHIDRALPVLVDAVGPATAHYNLGVILHEEGHVAASEEQFVAAILENPRLTQAQRWLNDIRKERQEQNRPTGPATQTATRPVISGRPDAAVQPAAAVSEAAAPRAGHAPVQHAHAAETLSLSLPAKGAADDRPARDDSRSFPGRLPTSGSAPGSQVELDVAPIPALTP